jgi:hypothetical protein
VQLGLQLLVRLPQALVPHLHADQEQVAIAQRPQPVRPAGQQPLGRGQRSECQAIDRAELARVAGALAQHQEGEAHRRDHHGRFTQPLTRA